MRAANSANDDCPTCMHVCVCPVRQFNVQLYVEKVFIAQKNTQTSEDRGGKVMKRKLRYGVGRFTKRKELGEGRAWKVAKVKRKNSECNAVTKTSLRQGNNRVVRAAKRRKKRETILLMRRGVSQMIQQPNNIANQPANQSANQPANQPASQSVSQPASQRCFSKMRRENMLASFARCSAQEDGACGTLPRARRLQMVLINPKCLW